MKTRSFRGDDATPRILERSLRLNRDGPVREPQEWLRSSIRLARWRHRLRALCRSHLKQPPEARFNAIHLFGPTASSAASMSLLGALAIMSARIHHPSTPIYLHAPAEPVGSYWKLVRHHVRFSPLCEVKWYRSLDLANDTVRSLVLRLLVLREVGGLAVAGNALMLQNMDHLSSGPFVLGTQPAFPGSRAGTGSEIFAGQAGSAFGTRWLDAIVQYGRMRGEANLAWMTSRLPLEIYAKAPSDALILPHQRWFFPNEQRLQDFLLNESEGAHYADLSEDQFILLAGDTRSCERLNNWTEKDVIEGECLLARVSRRIFAGMPVPDLARFASHSGVMANSLIRKSTRSNQNFSLLPTRID